MIENLIKPLKDMHSVSVKEGKLLYKLAKESKGIIVEIGSWKGYSTIWLAKGSMSGGNKKVYAIDPHTGSDIHKQMYGSVNTYEAFISNITKVGVRDIITPLVVTSENAERTLGNISVSLLWIDGDHNDIEADFARWYPHLSVGGIIALHDTVAWTSMLPYKVAIKGIYKSGKFADIKRVGSITYARKVSGLTSKDKINNRIALISRYIYQLYIPYHMKVLVLADRILKRILK